MGAQRFYFDSFTVNSTTGRVLYAYSTDAGHAFSHELSFTFPPGSDEASLRPAAFALGMAELAHFWKAILAPEIIVKAGHLSPEQITFWENLYTQGLGEFFYINNIDFRGLVKITSDPDAPVIAPSSQKLSKGALVPFGGGKDSLVTGELLKKKKVPFAWFELEPLPFGSKLREVSGVTDCVSMGRDVARNFKPVMDLVAKGAPNGHVPITATYMMSAAVAAEAYGYSDIVMSLERSASEGNVEYLGTTINHQYSKSYEFECAAREYIRTYVNPSMQLFSLLRPLYEIQIVKKFALFPQYFPYFVSCNRGLKTTTWCGECAKCAFMFAALSAFLPPEKVTAIFGKNLFEDTSLIPLYEELIGLRGIKPFDCVGTFDENKLALYLATKQYKEVPPVLAALSVADGEVHLSLLECKGEANIPAKYV